jgi:hypothetical protein
MHARHVWVLGIGILLAFGIAAGGGGSTRSPRQSLASDPAAVQAVSLRSSDFPPAWSSSRASNGIRPKAHVSQVAKLAKLGKPAGPPAPSDLESLSALAAYNAYNAYLVDSFSRLRMCESSDNYQVDTGNGYYGAYQFDEQTWLGLGYTGYPSDASPTVQDQAAWQLQAQRGWEPWPTCSRVLGL